MQNKINVMANPFDEAMLDAIAGFRKSNELD